MPQPALLSPPVLRDAPRILLWPRFPYVYAFALVDSAAHAERIALGELISVIVPAGTLPIHDPHDWFASRVPVSPPVTGPLHIAGIDPGDTLQVAVLAIDAADPMIPPPALTVAITGRLGSGSDPVQIAIPAGGMARVPVRRPGGLLTVGPVLAAPEGGDATIPVAGTVTLRCTCVQPRE
jgi:acetamidase/formamidase